MPASSRQLTSGQQALADQAAGTLPQGARPPPGDEPFISGPGESIVVVAIVVEPGSRRDEPIGANVRGGRRSQLDPARGQVVAHIPWRGPTRRPNGRGCFHETANRLATFEPLAELEHPVGSEALRVSLCLARIAC